MSTREREGGRRPVGKKRLWDHVTNVLFRGIGKGGMDRKREESAEELMQVVQRVEGVVTVQSLRAREQGHYVVAEIVISVNPRITVLEGQDIAKRVKLLLMHRFLHLSEVMIYVEPYDPGYPYKSNHDPNQEQMPTLLQ
ncbi:cation transporter dimerization domain-containing protein [Paenibacillus sp. LHD-117]|uniref:cation transporter dimerization domain-containing protein n=1 Tax=Paenibacillus sp. LHD-117 TaxID=3071412 RepID=UPI0027DFDB65|nr:cation transporter dimerization domain-containing protein [Paenibacillus sp. LHD-117]MDQ6418595.1 cation transporter dimerization domain-containing protein [Paenibacillus sp. LHD-117]